MNSTYTDDVITMRLDVLGLAVEQLARTLSDAQARETALGLRQAVGELLARRAISEGEDEAAACQAHALLAALAR